MTKPGQSSAELYAYFSVAADGVTHRILNEAESAADQLFKQLGNLGKLAQDKKMDLVIAWDGERPIPFLQRGSDSTIDSSVISLRDYLAQNHMISMSKGADSIYRPTCTGNKGGVCCDWEHAAEGVNAFTPFRNIEQAIVDAARKEGVDVPSPAETAVFSLGASLKARAKAYKVFSEWIYGSPINPDNDQCFIPPQAQEITRAELDERTMGINLREYRSEHRKIWPAIKGLKQINL